jgi:hypothetical protein
VTFNESRCEQPARGTGLWDFHSANARSASDTGSGACADVYTVPDLHLRELRGGLNSTLGPDTGSCRPRGLFRLDIAELICRPPYRKRIKCGRIAYRVGISSYDHVGAVP